MFSIKRFLGVDKDDAPLLYCAYFAFFCSGMMANVLGCVLPYIRESYGFDYSFQGLLSSVNQIGNLCAVLLSGFLPYAIGRKNSTVILGSGIVLGLLLIAITGNPFVLLLAFVLAGVGRGTMSNITNVIVGQYASNKIAGLNLLHATFAIGAVISPSVVASLGPERWRIPLVTISLFMAFSLFMIMRSRLENSPTKKEKDEAKIPLAFSFWLNTFILFFYLCCEASLMNWLVTYLKDSGIFSSGISNLMASCLWVTILIGRLLCAYIASKMNKSILILILALMLTGFYTLIILSSNAILIFLGILGVGLSMSGIYPTTLGTQEKKFNKSTIATGTCLAVATLGSIIMPIVIGHVAQDYGIKTGMATIFVALICLLLLIVVKVIYNFRVEQKNRYRAS